MSSDRNSLKAASIDQFIKKIKGILLSKHSKINIDQVD